MNKEEFLSKAREIEKRRDIIERINKGKKALKEFLRRYPFREHPEEIDNLNGEKIYNPGSDDYFFLWIEHRTQPLGAIFTYGGSIYPNAVENIEKFKELLKIVVDENKTISEKIDAEWRKIKGFGGDKLIAKKILYCYFSDRVLPIFKTEHLEYFCRNLGFDLDEYSQKKYGKNYDELTIGEKYELLNELLIKFRNENLPEMSNEMFARVLYEIFQPEKRKTTIRLSKPISTKYGLLFEPSTEQEVVFLFSKLHKDLGFPYILRFQEKFPDVIVLDKDRQQKRIEIEVYASDFKEHGHDPKGCDYIVCWKNNLRDTEMPEDFPEIISLSDFIEED